MGAELKDFIIITMDAFFFFSPFDLLGKMSENFKGPQQLCVLLQLQPPVQPHRVWFSKFTCLTRFNFPERWLGVNVTPPVPPPQVRRERPDMGREDGEVSENLTGSLGPRLCSEYLLYLHYAGTEILQGMHF